MTVRYLVFGATTALCLYPFANILAAESVIWAFAGTKAQGSQPMANLISVKSGLYGTTSGNGSSNNAGKSYGTVFKLVPSGNGWAQRVLYVFKGGTDGQNPVAGLVQGRSGRLYGTTANGGALNPSKNAFGFGAVFELVPPAPGTKKWSESIIYAFASKPGGLATPFGSLIMDKRGVLFGTARSGGASGYGGVFELIPPGKGSSSWTEATLYEFSGGVDGGEPVAGLLLDTSGALYGTTEAGGENLVGNGACTGAGNASGCGVVFKLTPPLKHQESWEETVLYSFTGGADGAVPKCTLISDAAGNLYGTTEYGGTLAAGYFGNVFILTPPGNGQSIWTENPIYQFQFSPTDGGGPVAGLSFGPNGSLFGTTFYGGTEDSGTVYALSPPQTGQSSWSETFLYSFLGGSNGTVTSDGAFPAGSLFIGFEGQHFWNYSPRGWEGAERSWQLWNCFRNQPLTDFPFAPFSCKLQGD